MSCLRSFVIFCDCPPLPSPLPVVIVSSHPGVLVLLVVLPPLPPVPTLVSRCSWWRSGVGHRGACLVGFPPEPWLATAQPPHEQGLMAVVGVGQRGAVIDSKSLPNNFVSKNKNKMRKRKKLTCGLGDVNDISKAIALPCLCLGAGRAGPVFSLSIVKRNTYKKLFNRK